MVSWASSLFVRFDAIFEAEGIEEKRVGPQAPNLNAYAEPWVQSIKQECLDHYIVFGKEHLRHLFAQYVTHISRKDPIKRWPFDP
jgi:putative transposase